jgi:hypothetical protein
MAEYSCRSAVGGSAFAQGLERRVRYLENTPRPLQELCRLHDDERVGVPDVIGQRVEVPQVVRIEEGVFFREALELLFQEPGCVGEERRL